MTASTGAALALGCAAVLALLLDARRAGDARRPRWEGRVLLLGVVVAALAGAVLTGLRLQAGG